MDGSLGEVANIRPGSVVHQGDLLAAVVPAGKLRVVARFLPADALGRIRPGASARLRLHGFPWPRFGSVPAVVSSVASEVRDGRIRVEFSVTSEQPSVRVPLQHGLPDTVEVEVARTTPAALIVRPGADAARR